MAKRFMSTWVPCSVLLPCHAYLMPCHIGQSVGLIRTISRQFILQCARTSGENIGDTGLIQAYRAWQAQYDLSFEGGHEYLLPGLNYTREQLFFVSFARAWAQNIKPESAVQRVRTDPHSPNRFRVDGTLYNIPAFAEAFHCSSKAKACYLLSPDVPSLC